LFEYQWASLFLIAYNFFFPFVTVVNPSLSAADDASSFTSGRGASSVLPLHKNANFEKKERISTHTQNESKWAALPASFTTVISPPALCMYDTGKMNH
jgi:hypothetical protein